MRKFEAFLTNNGNIAVIVKDSSAVKYCAFISPMGEWLRECSHQEFQNIAFNTRLPLADLMPVRDFFDKILPDKAPVWELVGRIHIEEDYTSYKSETCNNGGDYAYYTYLDVYCATINDKVVIRTVTVYGTSAEFDYDNLAGGFQRTEYCQILNSVDSGYYTQGNNTCYLEQISRVVKLEDINNLNCTIICKDDNGEIEEVIGTPKNVDDIVAKLIIAGASFAPVKKGRRG